MLIYPAYKAQIFLLVVEEVIILVEYLDFVDVFSKKLAAKLFKRFDINKHSINQDLSKQPLYKPIYSLGSIKLKILKIYIKANLVNSFIHSSKSLAGALILFIQKPNSSFYLCVDYQGLNNLTIKNWYPLPLIDELLKRLGQAKQSTKFNLTSVYHQMRVKKDNE